MRNCSGCIDGSGKAEGPCSAPEKIFGSERGTDADYAQDGMRNIFDGDFSLIPGLNR